VTECEAVPFDTEWFNELRTLSDERLEPTRRRVCRGHQGRPFVTNLHQNRVVSDHFCEATRAFASLMRRTFYPMGQTSSTNGT
jgi:hypothetical protein